MRGGDSEPAFTVKMGGDAADDDGEERDGGERRNAAKKGHGRSLWEDAVASYIATLRCKVGQKNFATRKEMERAWGWTAPVTTAALARSFTAL